MKMMRKPFHDASILTRIVFLFLMMMLSGCNEELYSGLTEKEGNEMLSILLEEGIDTEKVTGLKGQLVTLKVDKQDMSRAIQILKRQGYPRDDFASVGELFKKDGLISSPLEEKARYVYGLSQEIAATLSQLDGVMTARVHIVIPNVEKKKGPLKVSSASVFIKHAHSVNLDDFVPQIKMLVNNSIEGLSYENISVALFPTQTTLARFNQSMESVFSIKVATESISRFYSLITAGVLLLILSIVGNIVLYRRVQRKSTMSNVSTDVISRVQA